MSDKNNLTEYLQNEWQMPLLPVLSLVTPMADLLPPNPFEKQGEKIVIDLLAYPESVAELLKSPEETEAEQEQDVDEEIDETAIILAKAIQEFYEHAPAFGTELFKQGFQPGRTVTHGQGSNLHFAARNGDVYEITRLLKSGMNVNVEDHRSSTPLHVAAMFGKNDAVSLLLKHGANIHDLSYDGYSVIQLAINHERFETAALLVAQGKVNPNQVNAKGESPLKMLSDAFATKMLSPELAAGQEKVIGDVQKIVDALGVFANHCGNHCQYAVSAVVETADHIKHNIFYKTPITFYLKSYAVYAPTDELRHKILQTANEIFEHDQSERAFINAKNLLNVFPTGKIYHLKVGNGEQLIMKANGHFKLFTTELIKNSLVAYVEKLNTENADKQKLMVFEKLTEIYLNAYEFVSKVGTTQAIEMYSELYEQGKTILIPSGWEGHFATVFPSKTQQVVGVGNSGDQYDLNQLGTTFYKNSESLDSGFIKAMALNQNKQYFEFDKMYEYGLMQNIGTLPAPAQKYGNCTLESHRDAVEGMALIELLNLDPSMKSVKELAHSYFEDWNAFLGHFQLSEYTNSEMGLPVQALIDIFSEVHQKPQGKFGDDEYGYAKEIVDILISPTYKEGFAHWLSHDSYSEKGAQLKQLFAYHGLDLTENTVHAPKVTEQHFTEAVTKFKLTILKSNIVETQSASDHVIDESENHAPQTLNVHMPAIDHIGTEMF